MLHPANPTPAHRSSKALPQEKDAPVTTNTPTPRAPEHVSYVIQAGRVDALYIPDPDADPRQVLDTILDRERWPGVEWIATLVRDGRR